MALESLLSLLLIPLLLSVATVASQGEERSNPYFLDEATFQERIKSDHGFTKVAPRFSQISNVLIGLDNFRLGLFQLDPRTFAFPHYFDASHVFYVAKGRGAIKFVQQQQGKESYYLEQGDIVRVPTATLTCLMNRDNNEKLQIIVLFQTNSATPGEFREFVGAGREDHPSFFNSFSDKILEASFNTTRKSLDRLFRQHRKGVLVKASREQIRALIQDISSSQKGGRRSMEPYNLLKMSPIHSNAYGQLYEVDAKDYKPPNDISFSFHNITKGGMVAPFYNSEATTLAVIVEGTGHFEMSTPHLSPSKNQSQRGREREQEEEGGSAQYQGVSAELSPRTAVIVPAGHPVTFVASNDQNLQVAAFMVNAEGNQRNYLAGKDNSLSEFEKVAKEVTFEMLATEVDNILNNQHFSVFLPGPKERGQE